MIMQGLTTSKRQGKLYLNIKLGEFFLKSENTEHEAYAVKETEFKDEIYPQRGLWFSELTDTITKVSVHDGNFGTQILIETSNNYIVQVPFDNKFGVQLMEKLPNVDLSKEVALKPYDFTDDKDKKRIQGITISQDDIKITSAYYDAETKKQAEGFPEAPKARNGGKVSSAQWKAFFTQRNVHLLDLFHDWIEKQSFIEAPQQAPSTTANATNHIDDVQGDDGKAEDLPF